MIYLRGGHSNDDDVEDSDAGNRLQLVQVHSAQVAWRKDGIGSRRGFGCAGERSRESFAIELCKLAGLAGLRLHAPATMHCFGPADLAALSLSLSRSDRCEFNVNELCDVRASERATGARACNQMQCERASEPKTFESCNNLQ